MSLLLAVLLQVGPAPGPAGGAASQLPPEIRDRKPRAERPRELPQPVPRPPGRVESCIGALAGDLPAATESARGWRDRASGEERAEAGLCLGVALAMAEDWPAAEAAFLAGRDAARFQTPLRARLGSLAANAALAQGAAERALGLLDVAASDLGGAREGPVPVAVALDRARALVLLQRLPEAEAALTEARALAPSDPEAWLLSATLSRKAGRLAEAQTQIEKAGALLPTDPEVGLEAGVIAMLSGREEAARKSWQSVVAAAPQSAAASTAKDYLAQLAEPARP